MAINGISNAIDEMKWNCLEYDYYEEQASVLKLKSKPS